MKLPEKHIVVLRRIVLDEKQSKETRAEALDLLLEDAVEPVEMD